jgi:phosphosulfolactate synthase
MPLSYLQRKLKLYHDHEIVAFPGGQFLEYAVYHGETDAVFAGAIEAGYRCIEVSDNILEISAPEKMALIRQAREDHGLRVIGEVGSKVAETSASRLIEDISQCLEAGAWKVFVEAAEIFGEDLNEALIEEITGAVPTDRLIFEIPGPWIEGIHLCDQHAMRSWLVQRFGPEVNLANVGPADILEVETLRRGIGVAALKW